MSNFIQIPNLILNLDKKSKFEEAIVYATIRNEIKDNTLKASCSEKSLAGLLNCSERTINNYVATLKQTGLLKIAQLKQGLSGYPYNVYQFDYLSKDYFIVLPPFINDGNISVKLKGLLLFIKANCWKGTNFIRFSGKTTDLPKTLGIGKNKITGYLNELEQKRYIRFIGKSLHIIDKNFPLSIEEDMWNNTYQIIYDFCLSHDRIPPIKNVDRERHDKSLSWIGTEYMEDYDRLKSTLNNRCKNLPENLTLEYFCQALVNRHPNKESKHTLNIIL